MSSNEVFYREVLDTIIGKWRTVHYTYTDEKISKHR